MPGFRTQPLVTEGDNSFITGSCQIPQPPLSPLPPKETDPHFSLADMNTDWDQQINIANLFTDNLKTSVGGFFHCRGKSLLNHLKLAPIYLTLHVHRDQCYGQNLSQFNIHELFANKTPKHPSKLKKKKPSIFKPTYQDKWVYFFFLWSLNRNYISAI